MQRDDSIVGQEFGDLLVLGFEASIKPSPASKPNTHWRCLCLICGREKVIQRQNLISANVENCGCEYGKRAQIARTLNCTTQYVTTILTKGRKLSPNTDLAVKIFNLARKMGVQNKKYATPKKRSIDPY